MNLIKAKLKNYEHDKGANLYPYYAGFSKSFVEELLKDLSPSELIILDPWCGTGTTNLVANNLNIHSIGIDINPVMTIISKANLLNSSDLGWILENYSENLFSKNLRTFSTDSDDPLNQWFTEKTTQILRNIERHITYGYLKHDTYTPLICFHLTALFLLTKRYVKSKFSSSNPTWIKIAKSENERLYYCQDKIIADFKAILSEITKKQLNNIGLATNQSTKFFTASSTKIPLRNDNVDYVITSPPYCTRIDYAVSMKPELAILGFRTKHEFKHLRQNIIGTTTVTKKPLNPSILWGKSCLEFIESVKTHESVASNTYYYKNHIQYFNDMFISLQEIHRVLKPSGKLILVTQNSYYKDVYNDISQSLIEMSSNIGFTLSKKEDFTIRSISSINTGSSKYVGKKINIESIIVLIKK